MPPPSSLRERFAGCLLGLAVGDALGGLFEGQDPDWIARRFPTPEALLDAPPADVLHYTDDTQMAVGVAETLVAHGAIEESRLCRAFVANYVPSRGYGWGARRVLEAMEEGRDYRQVAETHFPGGSYGNGAAMRVAPVGLFFHDDLDRMWDQARLSALPTHRHPLGIEGAQLLAAGVALCARAAAFDRDAFFGVLLARCQAPEWRAKLERAAGVRSPEELALLGNRITALESVGTALACFASAPGSYGTAVARAVLLGGDTDTIAAMTGALSGALLGVGGIPPHLLQRLEENESPKGRSYIEGLAGQLARAAEAPPPPT
jgi:poly(ADP-ribose) glycohydrolase ARH3